MALSKHNKSIIKWSVDTDKDTPFVKANQLELGKEFPFLGCFITPDNKGFGEGGVIISEIDGVVTCVNTPASFIDTIREIRADQMDIEEINKGTCKFYVSSYKNKRGQTGYSITLVD